MERETYLILWKLSLRMPLCKPSHRRFSQNICLEDGFSVSSLFLAHILVHCSRCVRNALLYDFSGENPFL